MILVFKRRIFFLSILSCLISACDGDGDNVSPPETNPSPPATSAPVAPDSPPVNPGGPVNNPAHYPASPPHHWTPAEVKKLGSEELAKRGSRAALTDDQISDVLELLSPDQLDIVDPAYAPGLTHAKRETINKNTQVVSHLNPEFIQELFPEMTAKYLQNMDSNKVRELLKPDADLDNLKARAISSRFDYLWKDALQAFPLEKISLIIGDLKRCGSIGGLFLSCIYSLSPEQIGATGDKGLRYFSAKQLALLRQPQLVAITGKQLSWLTSELAAAFTDNQIPSLSPMAIAQIPVVCNGGKNCEDGSFSNLFADHLRPWTKEQLKAITLDQWKTLDPKVIRDLQARRDF